MALGKSPQVTDLGDIPMIVIRHGVPIKLMGQSDEANAGFEQVNLDANQASLAFYQHPPNLCRAIQS